MAAEPGAHRLATLGLMANGPRALAIGSTMVGKQTPLTGTYISAQSLLIIYLNDRHSILLVVVMWCRGSKLI